MTRGFVSLLGLFCVALLVSVIIFLDGSSNNSLEKVGKIIVTQTVEEEALPVVRSNHVKVNWVPWHGRNISDDNVLYKRLTLNETAHIRCPWNKRSLEQTLSIEVDLVLMYEKYIPIMGYNTLIDCLVKHNTEVEAEKLHALGTALGKYGIRHGIPPEHMIEVNSRYVLNLAPMHGVVWSLILDHDESDILPFARSLCDFQDSESVGGIWKSCVHGIGHGFGELFGYEGIDEALELCTNLDDDLNWVYSCSTGVFMTLQNKLEWNDDDNSRGTCMNVEYPATCFRFLPKPFYDSKFPCQNITDEYHIRGCVWGDGYNSGSHHGFLEAHILCESYNETNYYHICLDGFFHNIQLLSREVEKKYCATIQGDLAQEACFYYHNINARNFNAKETPWFRPEILEIN